MAASEPPAEQPKPAKPKAYNLGFAENFVLSGAAAVVAKTAAAPIERVKLLVQNQAELIKAFRLDPPYSGVVDCTVRTYQSEGLFPSFWRGNVVNCLRYFPTQALNFAFKDQISILFNLQKSDPYPTAFAKNIASGGLAGALSLCVVYSMDFARTRLANDAMAAGDGAGSRQYAGLIDVYRQTMRTDGIAGLYRGFVISCVGIVVYRGCYFGFYDSLKPIVLGHNTSVAASFALGYIVTVVSSQLAYPIDTIRRRMMMTSGQPVKYKGSIDCATQIIKNEGTGALFKGAGANILVSVAGAGVLAGFDKFKNVYIDWRVSMM